MNYEYSQYWIESMENIKLLEQLMENNFYMYQRTQDILYLEYIINNIKETFRLKQRMSFLTTNSATTIQKYIVSVM